MGDLSTHFSAAEFACKCGCGQGRIDPELVAKLEMIRDAVGFPLVITSGLRCESYNRKVGGAPQSAHKLGKAVDIRVAVSANRFALVRAAIQGGICRIGVGRDFVHLDIAESPAHPKRMLWVY